MKHLVLDTNVIVSALVWSGPPRELLTGARERQIRLCTSLPLIGELENVLNRPKFQQRIAALELPLARIISEYMMLNTFVVPEPIPPVAADPDDDLVLATALAAEADLIVSGDHHLLTLEAFRDIPSATP